MIIAFAVPFTHSDVLQAELDALLQGLKIGEDRSISQVVVETDSAMA